VAAWSSAGSTLTPLDVDVDVDVDERRPAKESRSPPGEGSKYTRESDDRRGSSYRRRHNRPTPAQRTRQSTEPA
jgi:hypothetical protein